MPKETKIKKSRTYAPTQRETYRFTKGVEPAAYPVSIETRVRPKAQGVNAEIFMDMMNDLQRGMKSAAGIKEQWNLKQQKEGSVAAAKGKAIPEDASGHFIAGFEKMKGMGEGYLELEKLLLEHYNQNRTADPYSFGQSQEQLIGQFFNGRSNAFIEGALPGALQLQKEYQGEFLKVKQEEFTIQKITAVRNIMGAEITKVFKDTSITNKAAALRAMLDDGQFLGKSALNLTKTEVSAQFVDILGRKAVEAGDPTYLNAAFLKDKNGVRLIDNPALAKKIQSHQDQAITERDRRIVFAQKQRDRAVKEAEADISSDMAELMSITDPQKRAEALQRVNELLYKYGDGSRNSNGIELGYKTIQHFYKEIRESSGPDGVYAAETNQNIKMYLYNKAKMSPWNITTDELEAAKPYLEKSDYEDIYKTRAQSMRTLASQGHKKSVNEKRWDSNMSNLMKKVRMKHPIFGDLYYNGPERELQSQNELYMRWDEFKTQNNKEPNLKEQMEILKDVNKWIDETLPAIPISGLPEEASEMLSASAGTGKTTTPSKTTDIDEVVLSGLEDLKDKKAQMEKREEKEKTVGLGSAR